LRLPSKILPSCSITTTVTTLGSRKEIKPHPGQVGRSTVLIGFWISEAAQNGQYL